MDKITFQFVIKNASRDKLTVVEEPLGNDRAVKSGGTIRLSVEGPVSDDPSRVMELRVEEGNRISVFASPLGTVDFLDE